MLKTSLAGLMLALVFAVGCASNGNLPAFQTVDLTRDLDPATVARYQAASVGMGHEAHGAMIESSNGWLLGLLAYWKQGNVRLTHGPDGGVRYVVAESRGYGPLAGFYVTRQDVTYDADGKRLSGMTTGAVGFGHIYMFHKMDEPGPGGTRHIHSMSHVMHHIFNWVKRHGETDYYLFSTPNPVGTGH
jgi:hypothetical protein